MLFDWMEKPGLKYAAVLCSVSAVVFSGGCGEYKVTDEEGRLLDAVVLGETGIHPGQFVYPRAMDVYVDELGRSIAIIIDKTARMQAIDLGTGDCVGSVLMPEFSNGMPTGVTIGASLLSVGELAAYVPDTHEHRVLVYALPLVEEHSEPVFSFGVFGEEQGQFVYPTDVALLLGDDGQVDELVISEYGGNDRVTRYAVSREDGVVGLRWNGQIGVASETVDGSDDPVGGAALSRPQSIGVWENGGTTEIVVVDSSHHRIIRMGLDGGQIATYEAGHDPAFAAMKFPYGITVLNDGSALITEFGGCVVRQMDLATGKTEQMFGVAGRGDGELATPWASHVIDGSIVILDSGNNRLQMIDSRVLGGVGDSVPVAGLGGQL